MGYIGLLLIICVLGLLLYKGMSWNVRRYLGEGSATGKESPSGYVHDSRDDCEVGCGCRWDPSSPDYIGTHKHEWREVVNPFSLHFGVPIRECRGCGDRQYFSSGVWMEDRNEY